MIEGNLTNSSFDRAPKVEGLKPLDWQALVVQLAAARELRAELAGSRDPAKGNFACFSASDPAGEQVNENRVCINSDTLADGKSFAGKKPEVTIDTQSGDRE